MKLVFGLKSVLENPYPREPFQYIYIQYIYFLEGNKIGFRIYRFRIKDKDIFSFGKKVFGFVYKTSYIYTYTQRN